MRKGKSTDPIRMAMIMVKSREWRNHKKGQTFFGDMSWEFMGYLVNTHKSRKWDLGELRRKNIPSGSFVEPAFHGLLGCLVKQEVLGQKLSL